jgi:hypothetical protein
MRKLLWQLKRFLLRRSVIGVGNFGLPYVINCTLPWKDRNIEDRHIEFNLEKSSLIIDGVEIPVRFTKVDNQYVSIDPDKRA